MTNLEAIFRKIAASKCSTRIEPPIVARMRTALEFYANEKNWTYNTVRMPGGYEKPVSGAEAYTDKGAIARAALEK